MDLCGRPFRQITDPGQKTIRFEERLQVPFSFGFVGVEEAVRGAIVSDELTLIPKLSGFRAITIDVRVWHGCVGFPMKDERRR